MHKNLAILLFCAAAICSVAVLFILNDAMGARNPDWTGVIILLAIPFAIGLASFVGGNLLWKTGGGNLIACSECGVSISPKAEACIKCGAPITKAHQISSEIKSPTAEGDIQMCKYLGNGAMVVAIIGAICLASGAFAAGLLLMVVGGIVKIICHIIISQNDK